MLNLGFRKLKQVDILKIRFLLMAIKRKKYLITTQNKN